MNREPVMFGVGTLKGRKMRMTGIKFVAAIIVIVAAIICAFRVSADIRSPRVITTNDFPDVKVNEILPIKVMYESRRRKHAYASIIQISEKEVLLQKWQGTQLVSTATNQLDLKVLAKAIENVPKDYFRGKVDYTNPHIRDGARVRMITPLGDISEYGVFALQLDPEQWPQSILKLAPLFRLFDEWSIKLENDSLLNQSPRPSYRSEVKVQPFPVEDGKPRQYFIEIEVMCDEQGKRPYSVTSPHLSVVEGKEAVVGVELAGSGFTTTALVTRVNGGLELSTTVTEKKDGTVVWSETKQTVIKE